MLVVIRADAVGNADMPSGPYSENGWHLMFQKKARIARDVGQPGPDGRVEAIHRDLSGAIADSNSK